MRRRILWNDMKNNRLTSVSTWLFMTLCAFMTALTCFLFINLTGSVDRLMKKAQTPDFLQMHTGEISETELFRFAEENEKVSDYQTLSFLNLENSAIILNDHSLADSTQDNGVCVQSDKFDYLLDMNNGIIQVSEGEIYVPVCYRQEYDLMVGERVQIGEVSFVIAGFLRDSQMNSMMASSKRLLVSPSDYERLKTAGSEEYLIEFLLKEGADTGEFSAEYTDAGLPSNGPAITKPLIRLMNALSDGLMILVILLVSVALLLISMLCIRFTLLTQLENDRKEIGILKAVGISGEDIFYLYFTKFLALSGLGAAAGLIAALLAEAKISVHIQELYGMSESRLAGILAAFAGAALTEGILLFSVRRTLKRMERLSAVEALTGQQRIGKEKKGQIFSPQYLIVASFTVNAGEMVAVMGPSGSGKSTLLYQVSGMDRADSGEVWINGTEICSLSEDEKAKLRLERMGFVFQQMNMLKNLNLIDNIMVPACHLKKGRRYREEITFRAHALMKKMGIGELAQRKITEVSGGQLQRACICRSLMNRPEILFADEPTGALNQKAAREVMEEFIRLNQEGVTILMVTHDSKVAAGCSRILYLLDGSIKGELHLAGLPERKKREEKVSRWLEAMGW